jgi:hypothetical protein
MPGRRGGNTATVPSLPTSRSRYGRSRSNDSIDIGSNRYGRSRSNDSIGSTHNHNHNHNINGNGINNAILIPAIQSNGSGTASCASSQTRSGTTTPKGSSSSSSSKKKAAEAAAFYPKLITAQIVALQCLHYFLLAVCIQINNVLYRTSITIDRIFTDEYVRLWSNTAGSWADVTAILLVSLVGSVLLAMIVEKSKKCLDFAVTLFLIHLGICTLYGGFPTVLDWWIVQVTGTILMVLLGEYLCSLRELGDIPLLQL